MIFNTCGPRKGDNSQATRVITQALLARYHTLKAQREEIAQECENLRQHLLALLDAGAAIEQGPLDASVCRYQQRPLTLSVLRSLLGRARVEALQAMVTPVERQNLIVKAGACRSRRDS